MKYCQKLIKDQNPHNKSFLKVKQSRVLTKYKMELFQWNNSLKKSSMLQLTDTFRITTTIENGELLISLFSNI